MIDEEVEAADDDDRLLERVDGCSKEVSVVEDAVIESEGEARSCWVASTDDSIVSISSVNLLSIKRFEEEDAVVVDSVALAMEWSSESLGTTRSTGVFTSDLTFERDSSCESWILEESVSDAGN